MTYSTCVVCALCGISVRFQTLFPSQRQVAHALLTRPPLSYKNASRRINLCNSVRLECVMHAASVHPEPGSNSRKNCISTGLRLYKSSELFSCSLLLEYTLLSMFLLKGIYEISFTLLVLCTFSLVVQFSRTVPLSSSAAFRLPAPVASRRALA